VAVTVTAWDPTLVKVWTGFWTALVAPPPKFHSQAVTVPPELVAVKFTFKGAPPLEGEAVAVT
jgi:hypothetical protein